MMIDARQIESGADIRTDVCIVGGGAAGIALALDLSRRAIRVVLLEGGGLKPDPASQSLYAGEHVGLKHEPPEDSRSRFLGGSTNCWGGWCRPLDEFDFETRAWVPDSGWPIRKRDLSPYYQRAATLLELEKSNYSLDHWAPEIARRKASVFPLEGADLVNIVNQLSPPTRFGRTYREALSRSPRVKLLLYANVTQILTNDNATEATGVEVATLNGKTFVVHAGTVALCAGGIENARLLLLSNRVETAGLGNGRDLVGRYYMDHPRAQSTRLFISDAERFRPLYDALLHRIHRGRGEARARLELHLAPSAAAQRRLRLPNSRTYLVGSARSDVTASFFAMKRLQRAINGRRRFGYPLTRFAQDVLRELPILFAHAPGTLATVGEVFLSPVLNKKEFLLESVIEPVPNRDSRVMLGEARDRLGLNQVRIDWRLTEQDRDHFKRLDALVVDALCNSGVAAPVETDAATRQLPDIIGCWHHMGTTRMHDDPAKGVVDADCRLHGVRNLFVGGSSVFPTVGSDSPTITLVALALRLGDRIADELRRRSYEAIETAPAAQPDRAALPVMALSTGPIGAAG